MPRPPPDDDEAFPPSITGMQRRAAERARRERHAFGRGDSTDQLPGRSRGAPFEVRAGDAVADRVRRAGHAARLLWFRLGERRVAVLAGVALVCGCVVGGVLALGMRQALGPEPPRAAPGRTADERPAPAAPRGPAAEAPPPEAPPPRSPVLGARAPATLLIISEPFGADIAINGQATGLRTPDSVEGLAPGRTYRVTLTRKGFQPWEEPIDVPAGGPRQVSARLVPAGRKGAAPPRR
jgi:hypothetical protein